ncbi:hypothetical protein E9993_13610 [Labilibacter sediminis]|nr:hypothetical protein E9993_13610 [Labilibacter sediminis]
MESKSLRTKLLLYFSLYILQNINIEAQENDASTLQFLTSGLKKSFSPIVVIEPWSVYSLNKNKGTVACFTGNNLFLRRFRFGTCGKPYKFFSYNLTLDADRLGEHPQKMSNGAIGIWTAYITLHLLNNSENVITSITKEMYPIAVQILQV